MSRESPKPAGLRPEYAAQFEDGSIVRAYRHRAPYPAETFEILTELTRAQPAVLDLGCGSGDLTVGISAFARTVDAVDLSRAMIGEAEHRRLSNVRWITGAAETAPLSGPYDLITAAESLHWMDWPRLFPRLASVLAPHGVIAIVNREYARTDWWTREFQAIIDRYSTNKDYRAYDLVDELAQRQLLTVIGSRRTRAAEFEQNVADLIEAFHSRNGFSRERMTVEAGRGFDADVAAHLAQFASAGVMNLGVRATVTWGTITAV